MKGRSTERCRTYRGKTANANFPETVHEGTTNPTPISLKLKNEDANPSLAFSSELPHPHAPLFLTATGHQSPLFPSDGISLSIKTVELQGGLLFTIGIRFLFTTRIRPISVRFSSDFCPKLFRFQPGSHPVIVRN